MTPELNIANHVFGERGDMVLFKIEEIKWLNEQRLYFESMTHLNPMWKTKMSLYFSGTMNAKVEKLIDILNNL